MNLTKSHMGRTINVIQDAPTHRIFLHYKKGRGVKRWIKLRKAVVKVLSVVGMGLCFLVTGMQIVLAVTYMSP